MRPASGRGDALSRAGTGLLRRLRRHRRLVAAVLVAVAAGLAVDAVAPEAPPGVPVVVATADLAAGATLGDGDVVVTQAPAGLVPDGAAPLDEAVGGTLAAPLRRGEIVTDARVLGPGLLAGQPDGSVAVPVRPSDPAAAALLRPGDRVRVLAGPSALGPDVLETGAGEAEALVDAGTVLALPADGSGGLLSAEAASTVLVLAVSGAEALRLAAAGDGRWLSVALLP